MPISAEISARPMNERTWKQGRELPLVDQLKSTPLIGEGFIRRITEAAEFQSLITSETRNRFPQEPDVQARIQRAYESTMNLHRGQKRRRTGAEAATHPIRVALSVMQDKEFSEGHIVIGLFHDGIEDQDKSPQEIKQMAERVGYKENDADFIAQGVYALSRVDKDGTKITEDAYMAKLDRVQRAYPALHVAQLKTMDTIDNNTDDTFVLITHPERANTERMRIYLAGKNEHVVNLATTHAPEAVSTKTLITRKALNQRLLKEIERNPNRPQETALYQKAIA